ncbi:MAG: S41 family peptidase [Elusimicrobia bacterium]|nr:S41 family peptidase [Elusimicrobiota bacterium]
MRFNRIMKKISRRFSVPWLAAVLTFVFAGVAYNLGVSSDSAYEKIRILIEMFDHIEENYVEEVEFQDLIYGAAAGMVRTLDPFSQFLKPEALKEMKVETEGAFGGIGIRVNIGEDGWLTVVTPLPGTPAFKAGVYPRDRIIKIDGQSTEDITIESAVKKLRGKPGTKVIVTVARLEEEKEGVEPKENVMDFALTREEIKIQTIYSRMIPGSDIGYIRMTEFNAKTPQDMHEMMDKLTKEGMQAMVLDLRFNPGGLLPSAIEAAKEFIGENKIVVYTQGRRADSKVEYRAAQRAPYANLPLAVLTNEGSASGSEILAGALQDHRRAILIGARTFGKASVQTVLNLPDGAGLRLTTAYYYTPNGRLIHRKEYKRKKAQDEEGDDPEGVPLSPEANAAKEEKPSETQGKDKKTAGESEQKWGIDPDIEVKVDRETAAKVYQSFDLAYFPDKPNETKPIQEVFKKSSKDKDQKSNEKAAAKDKAVDPFLEEKDKVSLRDVVLDRAVELLKARNVLLQMPR